MGPSGGAEPAKKAPDLYQYTNYRLYLQDYYQSQKIANPDFSLRYFAKQAKFPSHGLLSYLMEGKRNLGKKTLDKLATALDLRKDQAQYFENLVFFNQARSIDEKTFYYERLLRSPVKSSFRKLETSQLQIFRRWYNIAIRELLNLKEFRNNPNWISERLLPKVEHYEVKESLEMLLAQGLIKKTANGFKAADPDITTDDEVKSFLVKNYHLQMLKIAAWAQEEVPSMDRDISSVCMAIKESELPNLKKHLQLMRKELRSFRAEDGTGERIIQVNIQLFPLSRGR
ncbi:MAG: TIGR02147 family protein [Fibrobacteria bacterium]